MVGGPCWSPLSCFIFYFILFYIDHYGSLPRWIATVSAYPRIAGSGGIRMVRDVATRAAGGRGYATCIVPFSALPLVPSQWEYLFSSGFTPPAAILSWGIYTNIRAPADLI